MASKYDDLDASTELEQKLTEDLRSALEGRGCEVVHHGTNSGGRHSPGGKPDIEVRDHESRRLILVEVTKRRASSADDEFIAVTDHLQRAITAGGYSDYGVLYVSPATSARLSSAFRDLWNRGRSNEKKQGRVIALDFATAEMMLSKLAAEPSELYPAERFGALFESWPKAIDDSLTRLLIQQTIFPEDLRLAVELENEVDEFAAEREQRLKKQLRKIEDDLRERGVTGDDSNRVLIYLTFLRLYEERRQRVLGEKNRFTVEGFGDWCREASASTRSEYGEKMVEALLHEVAEDDDLKAAGLLRDGRGVKHPLHDRVRDSFVVEKLLPVFDEYDFQAGRVDVLGAVFETLARRAQKDTRVGQFFTPQPVVDFCASMVPLKPRDVVLDPAVGTARFLIRAMDTMVGLADSDSDRHEIKTERLLGTDIDSWVATIAKMNMYIHGDGKTNILEVNGLVLGDRGGFKNFPKGLSGRVDVVLTNPPLGDTSHVVAAEEWRSLGNEGDDKRSTTLLRRLGVVPMRVLERQQLDAAERSLGTIEAEIAQLEAALPDEDAQRRLRNVRRTRDSRANRVATLRATVESGTVTEEPANDSMKGGALFLGAIADYLTPNRDSDERSEWRGGWAAVVVDEAILNTPEYGPTRAFIRDRFYIKAVVSLSREAFEYLAHTSAKTSVLFLVLKPEAGKTQSEPVFFAHAERVGYSRTGAWIGDDLPLVKLSYEQMGAEVKKQYVGAKLDPSAAQEAAEGVTGFGEAFHAMGAGSDTARLDFFNARYMQRCRELREQFGEVPVLGDFLEVAPITHPEPNRRGEYEFAQVSRVTGTVQPIGVQAVNYKPRELWVVREGDLVVSGIDVVRGSVAVAGPDVDGMVMSGEMYAYRVKDEATADATYLALLLRTEAAAEMLEGMATGTSNRTRLERPEQLLELPIPPLPLLAEQKRIADIYDGAVEARRGADTARREAESVVAEVWPEREVAVMVEADVSEHEFERFESLTRDLLTVPKADIDAKLGK
jgi:type I restriction-modification system DNA methylase subunit